MGEFKMVRYDEFCPRCKHYEKDEMDHPCDACCELSVLPYSSIPKFFSEEDKAKRKKRK